MALRFATFALLALSSTISAQFIEDVTDDDQLVSYGVAECIEAIMHINDLSVDITTIRTGGRTDD